MTRWIITAIAVGAITALSAAPGCAATGVGDPCTPDEEYDPTFQGFAIEDVSTESKSYVCLTRLCLVNHFQGRVTCPYGQAAYGIGTGGTAATATMAAVLPPAAPAGSPAAEVNGGAGYQLGCSIPGTSPSISSAGVETTGWQISATNVSVAGFASGSVPPQVTGAGAGDRTANQTVYCSCRCANLQGNTNDGDNYCACPDNYTCTPLVTSIGASDSGLTGSYCVKNGSDYAAATTNTASVCNPTQSEPNGAGYCPIQY